VCTQIRKVSFAQISYSFSRNAPFDVRNVSSEVILLKVKIDGVIPLSHPQIGGLPYMYINM
jgi:hypothetical protein